MKLLFDQNISYRIKKKLEHKFSNCIHVSDCGLQDNEDPNIWEYAKLNGFTIVTFDADFFEISLINGHPPKIIWIRSGNLTTNDIVNLMLKNFTKIQAFYDDKNGQNLACMELEL